MRLAQTFKLSGCALIVLALSGLSCGGNSWVEPYAYHPLVSVEPIDGSEGGEGDQSASGSGNSGSGGGAGSSADHGGLSGDAYTVQCAASWLGDIQMGTGKDDEISALAIDGSNNLYVTGYESGVVGVENIDPTGNSRAVVMKYSSSGERLWKHALDTSGTDVGEAVKVDPESKRIYVAGRTSGALKGFSNQGQFDLFFEILDQDGAGLSAYQGGTERPQHPRNITIDSAGGVVIAGYDDLYVPTNYLESWEDPFVAKFTVDKTAGFAIAGEWWHQYGTDTLDVVVGLATDDKENIYVSGLALSGATKGPFVSKFHADGSKGWVNNLTKSPNDFAYDVVVSPSGDLYVTGATFLQIGAESFGQQDAFLIKLDKETGEFLWTAQFGSSESDWPTSIAFDAEGHIYLAGTTGGSLVPGYPNQGEGDLFVLKVDASGAIVSAWQHGTAADEYAVGIVVNECKDVFVAGYTEGALFEGQPNIGGRDMFLMKVDM